MTFVPIYILILFATIILDYTIGIYLEKFENNEVKQHRLLVLGVIINIAFLAFFKYYNFFIENVNALGASLSFLKIILPIGLSFHTFQALAYLFEVYRGNQRAEKHFGIYALYVMFYPQLVAGPIERPQHILPQLRVEHKFSWPLFYDGLRLMLWGFFKKVVVADRISIYVDIMFQRDGNYHHFGNVLIGVIFFLIQVYCDFSAYSDIALGAAKTMGINLMINFNRPLESRSISEFWRRWHISLSSWFNDYVFTAISASTRRLKYAGLAIAVLITFTLSGLWHGAAWTFVIFGLIHGAGIVFEIFTKKIRLKFSKKLPAYVWNKITWLITFLFVSLTVVFFRAETMSQALHFLHDVFSLNTTGGFSRVIASPTAEFGVTAFIISIFVIIFTFTFEHYTTPTLIEFNKSAFKDITLSVLILFMIFIFGVFQKNTFIYFQF